MAVSNPYFIDTQAAAQFIGPGAVWLEEYQQEMTDLLKRTTILNQRLKQVKATGQPSRYFENLKLAGGAAFSNPRTLAYPGQVAPVRGENTVALKALVDSLDFSMFDTEVNEQQGVFTNLQGSDMEGFLQNFMRVNDTALMLGTASNPQNLPTVDLQYCGIDTQVLRPSVNPDCAAGANVVDFLTGHIATMAGSGQLNLMPSGIELHPTTIHKIEVQERAFNRTLGGGQIIPGVTVNYITTVLGNIPLIPNYLIPEYTQSVANDAYSAFILTDSEMEYHWLKTPEPRVFQMGTTADLAQKFVVVKFGGLILKNCEDPFNAGEPAAHRKLSIAKA